MSEIQTTKTLNIDYSLKLDCEGNRVEPEMWKIKDRKDNKWQRKRRMELRYR